MKARQLPPWTTLLLFGAIGVVVGLAASYWADPDRPGDKQIWSALQELKREYHSRELLSRQSESWKPIETHGRESFETLSLALHDPDDDIRLLAAMSMRRLHDDRAVLLLASSALNDPCQPVRLESVSALGEFQKSGQLIVPALAEALKDENDSVVWVATESLAKTVTNENDPLLALSSMLRDEDKRLRISAAIALIVIGHRRPVETQPQALDVFVQGPRRS